MHKYYFLSLVLVCLLYSCNSNRIDPVTFMMHEGDRLIGVITKSPEKSIFYSISVYRCDTMLQVEMTGEWDEEQGIYITKVKDHIITHDFSKSPDSLTFSMNGEFQTLNLKPDHVFSKYINKKQRVEEFALLGRLLTADDELKLLMRKNSITSNAKELVSYIDSLEKEIFIHVQIDSSEIECIVNHDSLKSFRALTKFLINEPANPIKKHFSAWGLKIKLNNFLSKPDNQIVGKILFPQFDGTKIKEMPNSNGLIESWESYHFYGVPLWAVLLELKQIKIKAIKVDLLAQKSKN